MRAIIVMLAAVITLTGVDLFGQSMQIYTRSGQLHEFKLSEIDSITFLTGVLYAEDFAAGANGWQKVAGPGVLEVVNGTFRHTSAGFSVWCEYAFTTQSFGNAIYELDVYVDSSVVGTSFCWRAPDTNQITANGGAYQVRFNNSELAPGGAGHFIVEKFDRSGRVLLLDLSNRFYGLNHLTIEDKGTSLIVTIANVSEGVNTHVLDVSSFAAVLPGYMFLIGGDRGGGDFFDNITVR